MTKEELKDLTISYYSTYNQEIEQTKTLLEIRLAQQCLAYTSAHGLPKEALVVKARIKPLDSFLKKLEKKGWPVFNHPAEVINDFIGARIICWFLDDCTGILKSIMQSTEIEIISSSIENYILNPKSSGYRALHVLADVNYNGALPKESMTNKIICEIQIRTRLQDAWGDITHDLYYRAKHVKQADRMYYSFLNAISKRLLQEDNELLQLRNVYTLPGKS
ncbi:MAG: hypothetical protein JWR61_621 [Ferruginibacter sp.]|uniref:GTP pyrophosphokinase n=1 Tax=Ferruginibacter sp. TaxID=1940288 RepID=UPI00265B6A43|nr:hypothetical protein [Ferruginibacter sp.]MDB5275666.1 hypothetical protein [Ferruginibacter sp.]